MDEVLYNLMDRPAIEKLVLSETDEPGKLLGAHQILEGILYQAYLPGAQEVVLKTAGREYPMEREEESGFFAVLLHGETRQRPYRLFARYGDGVTEELEDPYSYRFQTIFKAEEIRKFQAGVYYDSYEKLGAHPMTISGVPGVHFAVWAPNAMRVSVVGDFNFWDGRRHQMNRVAESGIFELFLPGVKPGALYKYEIKTAAGVPILKADPYAFYAELRPHTASIVWDGEAYPWTDADWLSARKERQGFECPIAVYEVHLGSWRKPGSGFADVDAAPDGISGAEQGIAAAQDFAAQISAAPTSAASTSAAAGDSGFGNYRELARELAAYVKEMGYTHIELLPVMEHPLDESLGYEVTGYFAPTSRYGTPDDFKAFMDYMHREEIGVILDWTPSRFPRDAHGLAAFDGTCLYEESDGGVTPETEDGEFLFHYGRPEVDNFLISNALYWAKEYHADGIRVASVESMLCLDYGKNAGEWVANMYGTNENLDAVEFIRHLNDVFHREVGDAILIAEESSSWPQVTGAIREDGLGFDYKWNMEWLRDFLNYMRCEPEKRREHYGELTFSVLYAYCENFMLELSHNEVIHGKGSLAARMPGETQEIRFANLRAAYGFMIGHPGKKLLFMGQDFGQMDEWDESRGLEWELLQYPIHRGMREYVKALNHLYRSEPALYRRDGVAEGFEWINCMRDEENILIFARWSEKPEETLLFVCNFLPVLREDFRVGVPFVGEYRELLNCDAREFGGSGIVNMQPLPSEAAECDGRPNSIVMQLPPLSVCIFRCTPFVDELEAEYRPEKRNPRKRQEQPGIRRGGAAFNRFTEKVGKFVRGEK